MPQGDRMGKRLEMLLNVSVSGLQNVEKLSSDLKKNATSLRDVTKGLLDVEGGAEQAATNYAKFHKAAERIEGSQKKLSVINQQIAKEQNELSKLAQERASIDTTVFERARQNNNELMGTFRQLKELYGRVSQASQTTFRPLGESALDAKVDITRLRDELVQLEKTFREKEQAFSAPRDPRTGQFAGRGQEAGGIKRGEEPAEFAREQESLRERIKLMDQTIKKTEALQSSQQRYIKDRKDVIQTNEALARNAEMVGKSDVQVQALTDTKRRLIGELRAEGRVLNELSGQQLARYNQQTGEMAIKSSQITSIKRLTTRASRDLARQLDDTSRATRGVSRAKKQATTDTDDLRQQLRAQNEEWTVMRQRISSNNEALWGLRRQLGALRNQILVVLFATRGLRNMMSSARDTIIEVDQGMVGLRRTAIAMGQDFKHLESITRQFEKRGLQNADEAAVALRNILQTGMGVEEATNLLFVFTDAASFNARSQRDLTDSVIRASEAFRDQRAQGLQAIGVSQRMTDMVREHAMATGQQTAEVTGMERHMAIYNAIMDESVKFTGNANDLLQTFEGRLISLGGASKSTSESIGELLRPAFMQFTDTLIEGHGRTRAFIDELRMANREDIDKWVLRLNKAFEILMKTVGVIMGSTLQLALRYGNLIGILIQLIVAKTLWNKLVIRGANKLETARKAVEGYSFILQANNNALMTSNATMAVKNKVTGEMVTGTQALRLIYQKHRVDIINNIAALKIEAAQRTINIGLAKNTRVVLEALGMTKSRANAALLKYNSTLIATSTGLTRLKAAFIAIKAPIIALTATIGAAGGAMVVLTKISLALLATIGKFVALFIGIQLLTSFITKLTGAKDATNELVLANGRLSKSYKDVEVSIDRARRRVEGIKPEADIFGIDTQTMTNMQNNISEHWQRLEDLRKEHNESESEKHRAHLQDIIKEEKSSFQDRLDGLESYTTKVRQQIEDIRSFRLNIEEQYQDQVTQMMGDHGAQQLFEARKNHRDFERQVREHQKELNAIRESSELARLRIDRQLAFVRVNQQRQIQEEEKQLFESWSKDIQSMEIEIHNRRLDLEKESTNVIRQQFEIRRNEARLDHQERLRQLEEQAKGRTKALESEIRDISNLIEGTAISLDQEIQKILGSIAGNEQREHFRVFFEQMQDRIEGVVKGIQNASTPEDLKRWTSHWDDVNEVIAEVFKSVEEGGHGITRFFKPAIKDLDEATQNMIKSMSEQEKRIELSKRSLDTFRDAFDNYNKTLRESVPRIVGVQEEQSKFTDAVDNHIKALDDYFKSLMGINRVEEKREVSIRQQTEALEALEKIQEKIERRIDERKRLRDINDQIELNKLTQEINKELARSESFYNELSEAIFETSRAELEFKQNRTDIIKTFEDDIKVHQRSIEVLKDELKVRGNLLGLDERGDIEEKIEGLQHELRILELLKGLNIENFEIQEQLLNQGRERAESQAALAQINRMLSDTQQQYNEKVQHHQELVDIGLSIEQVRVAKEELALTQRFIPILGRVFEARTKTLNAQRLQQMEHQNELDNFRLQRQAITAQIQLLDEQLSKVDELSDIERRQGEMRQVQLNSQLGQMDQLMKATRELIREEERRFELERKREVTSALVDNLRSSLDLMTDFHTGMRDIRQDILLDEHRFQLELADQLRHGEVTRRDHNQLMIAHQRHLASREEHMRQMRLASLVRDVGREISLYAARMAAVSGNIPAAIALLAGGAGIMATAHSIASRIERQTTMRFQQAEIEFQRAQRQIQDTETGTSGDDSRARKFGGTIRADNLVVNISPTLIVDGEQIFIGSGSALEFSREVSELMLESIQQAVDDRRLDLSNIPRTEG